jgi:hypothetical protein
MVLLGVGAGVWAWKIVSTNWLFEIFISLNLVLKGILIGNQFCCLD